MSLIAGYECRLRLAVVGSDTPVFPVGVTLAAQIRRTRADTSLLATLTSDNGGLLRVSDSEIDIVIGGSSSADWPAGEVVLDLVRTDTDPDKHLGFALRIPVVLPVTRGL